MKCNFQRPEPQGKSIHFMQQEHLEWHKGPDAQITFQVTFASKISQADERVRECPSH